MSRVRVASPAPLPHVEGVASEMSFLKAHFYNKVRNRSRKSGDVPKSFALTECRSRASVSGPPLRARNCGSHRHRPGEVLRLAATGTAPFRCSGFFWRREQLQRFMALLLISSRAARSEFSAGVSSIDRVPVVLVSLAVGTGVFEGVGQYFSCVLVNTTRAEPFDQARW